jgi:hypothetical protein
MDKKINPSILSLIGLLVIIVFAVAGDRLADSLSWWFRKTSDPGLFNLMLWARSLQVLLLAFIFVLFSRFVFFRRNLNRLVVYIFIAVGLVLVFYPQIYLFTPLGHNPLFVYLAEYHPHSSSILYISGGLIAALGFILLASNPRNSAGG